MSQNLRSRLIMEGIQRSPNRSMLRAVGFTDRDIVIDFLDRSADKWVAEVEPRLFKSGDIFQIRNVELNFSVELESRESAP
jgi:hypothetical protein